MRKHLVLTLVLTAALGAVALPAAAATDPCLDPARLLPVPPTSLATTDEVLGVQLLYADCTDGGTVTVVTPTGETRQVPFDYYQVAHPPQTYEMSWGETPVSWQTGVGVWKLTKLQHAGTTVTLSTPNPITIPRSPGIVIDHDPFVVPAGSKAVISGVLQQYTSSGTPVPLGAGLPVAVSAHLIGNYYVRWNATATTDQYGRFRVTLPLTGSSEFWTTFAGAGANVPRADAGGAVLMQRSVTLRYADPAPTQWEPTKVVATAYPAGTRANLEVYGAYGWERRQYGNSDSTGSITFNDRPYDVGTQRVRVIVYGNDEGPSAAWEFSRTVRYRTSLDGVAAATNDTVIRPGTKMSTYGHLRLVKYGQPYAYGGQRIDIQTRPRGQTGTPYATVATATTSVAGGYYYANWTVQSDVDVRVQFLSTDADIRNAWTFLRTVDVQ
jgi:hypothetical protein